MPQSDQWAMPWVLETIDRIDPGSLLDFGIGMGAYGFQLRLRLDVGRGRLLPDEWKTTIDGIEIFDRYRNPVWSHYYNSVRSGDGIAIVETANVKKYDVILLCDVLEHFHREVALDLLRSLRSLASWVIVTTPVGRYPQGAVFSNAAETHLSEWAPSDLSSLGAKVVTINQTFMAVFGPDASSLESLGLERLPVLFHNSGRSLINCARRWFPLMLRSRFLSH